MPTLEELEETKRRVEYREGIFHFAVAGIAGSGKSSLINALRGLRPRSKDAARTGTTETISEIGRYPDPDPANPFVWYDIPGAGTPKIPGWQYFKDQGLYIFDCIIVLFDSRFTEIDVAILRNCERFNIPTYIVRSKTKMHIDNEMRDMGYDSEEDDKERRGELFSRACQKHFSETQKSVAANLENKELSAQRVYLVDIDNLLKIKQEKETKVTFDEWELLRDLLVEARVRRCKKRWYDQLYSLSRLVNGFSNSLMQVSNGLTRSV